MKLPFVSRKKYEIARNNYKVAMEGQSELKKKYIQAQEDFSKLCIKVEADSYMISDLKKEIKRLKTLLSKNGIEYKKEK